MIHVPSNYQYTSFSVGFYYMLNHGILIQHKLLSEDVKTRSVCIYVTHQPKYDPTAAARVPPIVPITVFAATDIPAAPKDKQRVIINKCPHK